MDTCRVLRVAFVSGLVTNLVNAQCPVTCDCPPRTINCRTAQLTEVPGGELPGDVMMLDLSYNMITTLHNNSFVVELSSVERLLLANNNIRFIDVNSLRNLDNLYSLDLSGNDISFISPETFSRNTNLMSLNLTNNPNLKLPDNGYNFPGLEKLELEQCRIKRIPAHFFKNMNNIRFLYLSINELSFLDPTNFKHLTNLKELDLSDNWFKVFQRELTELHSTTKLKISKNLWICDCYFLTALDYFERNGNKQVPVCKSPKQLRGLVANRTTINELFHCNAARTTATTTTTTTTSVVFYDAFLDYDWYDFNNYSQDYPVEKLAHMVGPLVEDGDVTDSRPRPLVNPSTDGDEVVLAASWFEQHQWWMYSAAVILLAAVIVTIINAQVNNKRKKYLLTNVHYNDDVW